MSDLQMGLPGGTGLPGFGMPGDQDLSLKKKSLPWPVFLALGIMVVSGGGYMAYRSSQNKKKLLAHQAFMAGFMEFEKESVGGFWRCMFGKEGDGRKFTTADGLNMQIESALMIDPMTFPGKVKDECMGKLSKAASKLKDLAPLPEYEKQMETYGQALGSLSNTIGVWAESAPKRVESKLRENKISQIGDAWSQTANPKKAEPQAWQYDKFLRCADPDIDKRKEGQELLEFVAKKCVHNTEKKLEVDAAYLTRMRDVCIVEAQEAPVKQHPQFAAVYNKFSPDFERMQQAFGMCFRKMNKEAKKDELNNFDQAWVSWVNGSSAIREIAVASLCEYGDEKACESVERAKENKAKANDPKAATKKPAH